VLRFLRKLTAVSGKRLTAALAPALLLAGITTAAGPAAAAVAKAACPAPIVPGDTILCGTLSDGATYLIEVPAQWNHSLFLYSHGFVSPGGNNPAQDATDPATGAWLLTHGFALAGSSYSSTGWAIAQALPDQIATLNLFDSQVGQPARTIAWGVSLGGMITAGLIQNFADRFNAALPLCGVLAGGVATWNTALDAAFAFQQLVDPSVTVTGITNPLGNLNGAELAAAAAQATPQGRARLALAAALGDTPGWFTTGSPEPAPTDFAAQEANQFQWESRVDFPFIFAFRAELEARAGGNPSWNTGVDYYRQLARSADRNEVIGLYRAAGLSLRADLRTLSKAPRISADPASVSYLIQNITYDGNLSIPVLTVHTTGDGLVVPQNEQAYASVVRRAGHERLLRQVFVHRAGHCAFTPAEIITSAQALLNRLNSGRWDSSALTPASMNIAAAALPPADNPLPPAFISFKPTRELRPFDRLMPNP
jgi:hypothetical protein